jgi:(R,R)-butanediol dehydrogenase/meso-butanediol dehydrogenase/diacetyl reductase
MSLSITYWARHLGAGKIVVLSRSPHRTGTVMAMGADAVLTFDETDRIEAELGGPPDIVAEGVGKPGMLDLATKHVRPQGTVLSLGQCQHGEPLVPAYCTRKEIRLFFVRGYSVDEFVETARIFDADKVRPEIMVSHVIALEELPATMEAMRNGTAKTLKVHVDPTRKA